MRSSVRDYVLAGRTDLAHKVVADGTFITTDTYVYALDIVVLQYALHIRQRIFSLMKRQHGSAWFQYKRVSKEASIFCGDLK
jgi:hypothetical protein